MKWPSKHVRNGGGHVYVVTCQSRRGVKVGFTCTMARRADNLSFSLRSRVCVEYVGDKSLISFRVERMAHQILAYAALGKEWFDVPASVAIDAVMQAELDVRAGWKWPRMACHDAPRRGKTAPDQRLA